MRISDWSSDVCSSDLFSACATACGTTPPISTRSHGSPTICWRTGWRRRIDRHGPEGRPVLAKQARRRMTPKGRGPHRPAAQCTRMTGANETTVARKTVVQGPEASVRVEIGERNNIKTKRKKDIHMIKQKI